MAPHPTFSSMKSSSRRDAAERLRHHASGGAVKQETKDAIEKAVHEHESHDHPGKSKTRLKFKDGGGVDGDAAPKRADRSGRKGGGKAGKKGSGNHVNIIVAGGHGAGGGGLPGAPGAGMPMAHPMGAPPMAPAGGPPPGAGGPPPAAMMPPPRPAMGPPVGAGVPGMRASGGRAGRKSGGKAEMDAGAGSALGRLEKIKDYGKSAPAGENHGETEELEDKSASDGKTENMKRGGAAKAD